MLDDARYRKFVKSLRTCIDTQLFSQYPLPSDAAWSKPVYQVQPFAVREPWYPVGFAAHGSMEARFVIEGGLSYMVFPTDKVPGEGIKLKRKWILNSSEEQLVAVVGDGGGWAAKVGVRNSS